eukprot:33122_1
MSTVRTYDINRHWIGLPTVSERLKLPMAIRAIENRVSRLKRGDINNGKRAGNLTQRDIIRKYICCKGFGIHSCAPLFLTKKTARDFAKKNGLESVYYDFVLCVGRHSHRRPHDINNWHPLSMTSNHIQMNRSCPQSCVEYCASLFSGVFESEQFEEQFEQHVSTFQIEFKVKYPGTVECNICGHMWKGEN